jgi:hypothetical protein
LLLALGLCLFGWPHVAHYNPVTLSWLTRFLLINRGLQFKNPTFICGTGFGEELYEPETNVSVAVISENFSSPERVKSELRTRLRHAVTIFERGPKIDDNGRPVGERVVAMMSPCRSSKMEANIFWTQGDTLTTIEAPSFRYAIAYELSAK